MTGWRSAAWLPLALLVGVLCTTPPAGATDDERPSSRRLFTFVGDDVYESSGLADLGSIVYTVNDSGDDAVVYGVDPRTGETVSRTTYADEATDVEALARGVGGTLWAGDIGDNRGQREEVTVYRVRPEDGDRPGRRFTLAYPDGARDAETLLVHPRSSRVFVVSKSVFGGTVYAAPEDLAARGPRNVLRPFAQVAGLVTDGAFFPDGRHVLLRTYETASVYTFPGFDLLGTLRLPSQRPGEAISVSPDGRVLISSEGVSTDVVVVSVPRSLTEPASTATSTATASQRPLPTAPPPVNRADPTPEPRGAGEWAGIGLVAAGVLALAWLTLKASRLRGPRGR